MESMKCRLGQWDRRVKLAADRVQCRVDCGMGGFGGVRSQCSKTTEEKEGKRWTVV